MKNQAEKTIISADPSTVTLFCDTATISYSGESIKLIFSQKLPFAEFNPEGAPTHKVISSLEMTVPFYLRMAELVNGMASQIKVKEEFLSGEGERRSMN